MNEQNEEVLTREALCEWLGITKGVLRTLCREHKFPFVQVTRNNRVFLEGSVLEWLRCREQNQGQSTAERDTGERE